MKKLKCESDICLTKRWHTYLHYAGLDYVTITHVPIFRFGAGTSEQNDLPENRKISHAVAKAIIRKKIPITGRELKFFRKDALGLTLKEFASLLSVTITTIHKWEKNATSRLHPINELAIRSIVVERLSIRHKINLLSSENNKTEFKISWYNS